MIFVTVGNATVGFRRLIEAVDSLAARRFFQDSWILIQYGNTRDYIPKHCEGVPFLSMDEYLQKMEEADLIVSHGGCGTILHALRLGKVPVVMPRRKIYGEIVNDHQFQLVRAMAFEDRVVAAYEPKELPAAIEEARRRRASEAKGSSSKMVCLVTQAVKELIGEPNATL